MRKRVVLDSMLLSSEVSILILASFSSSLLNFRGPLIESLVARGYQVHVAAPELSIDRKTTSWLRGYGVTWHDIPLSRAGLNPSVDFCTLLSLIGLMRRVRPSVFLGYTIKPVIWGMLAATISRVPRRFSLITGLGYAFTGVARGKRRVVQRLVCWLYRIALSGAHKVFFQNPDDASLFRDLGLLDWRKPVVLIHGSGVDLDWYSPHILPDEPVFLMIARLVADKGIREYVEAARLVKQEFPQTRFQLAGGFDPNPMGIKPDEVEAWIEEGVIEYLGELDDVRPALAATRFYVLPSYREGTPRTVLEAMATGRPVITTDAPGCRETVIDGENGFLVPVQNVEALRKAMVALLKQPELAERMAQRGLEIVRDKYDVHKVNAAIMEAMGL